MSEVCGLSFWHGGFWFPEFPTGLSDSLFDCLPLCRADVSRAAAEMPLSWNLGGDARIGDERLAVGRGGGGRGLSIVILERWLSVVCGC